MVCPLRDLTGVRGRDKRKGDTRARIIRDIKIIKATREAKMGGSRRVPRVVAVGVTMTERPAPDPRGRNVGIVKQKG